MLHEKKKDMWKGGRSAIWRLKHVKKWEAREVFGRLVKGKSGEHFPWAMLRHRDSFFIVVYYFCIETNSFF